ncbi:MBL fold metallo-hydrolase [Bdellovibrionota bacterium FG-2]
MKVKVWGARGSIPAPITPEHLRAQIREVLIDFARRPHADGNDPEGFMSSQPGLGGFGGNTLCVEVSSGPRSLIIDGGSGLRILGYQMMAGPCGKGKGEAHLLMTHFHWDHLIGLPFFIPLFVPGNVVHVYAVQADLQSVFRTLFQKPYFPVPLEKLGAQIVYHTLEPRKAVEIQGYCVVPYQLDHPDPCWGYRIEDKADTKVYSHCVDTECTRVSRAELGEDLPLYQGVDLMLFDAQYTLTETIEKVDWGHAAASLGLDIALREGIKRVWFVHHDPASNDEKIFSAESQARRYYDSQVKSARRSGLAIPAVEWSFACEGDTIEL